jgi:hypothetical protein
VRPIINRPSKAGQPSDTPLRLNWRTVLGPIDMTRPIAPYLLVRAMRLSLAIKFGIAWRIDGKAVRP